MNNPLPPANPHSVSPPALPQARQQHGLWKWALLVAVLLLIGYAVLVRPVVQRAEAAKGRGAPRSVPVGADNAKSQDLPVKLGALGTVTPNQVVTIRSRVDGELVRVNFQEGQPVESGALLAEIDARPYEVQKLQAAAQFAKDKALLDNAQVDLDRFRTLLAQDSVARQQVDTQEALVRQYEAALKVDQAQIESASLQLTYTKITSPLTGRAGLRLVDAGNMVHASDAGGLTVITQLQPIGVLFSIPQESLPKVLRHFQAGEPMSVTAFDRDGKTLLATGKLVTIDNQLDATTGTVKLRAEFPNTDSALFPNQFVNIQLQVEVLRDALVVPSAAIQRGSAGTFVYVVKDKATAEMRPVQTGPADGDNVSITQGISTGETVVIDGIDKLRDGAQVEMVMRSTESKRTPDTGGPGAPEKRKWQRPAEKDGAPQVAPR